MTSEPNQELLLCLLDQWLSRTRRHPTQRFALLLARLKEAVGATELGQIRSQLRCEDTLLPLDSHVLAILVADLRHSSDPLRIARRIQQSLPDSIQTLVIALSESPWSQGRSMLEEGQSRLDGPPGCFYLDPSLQKEAEERLELESSIEAALHQGQILPHYQPIVSLRTGRIASFEALARWQHPQLGLLLPEHFLSVAQDCGLLAELDVCILSQSLEQLSRWQQLSDSPMRLSVNLSPDHFLKPEGLQRLLPVLETYASIVPQLRVDVSERVLHEPQGLATLRELRHLKVGFHLDDFGVGPESFHCLNSFPFHSLKIDRSLICEMEEEVNAELIAALLRIARRMRMRTIAEGLITHAQLEELRNLGCNEAQGFLFSPAIPAEKALDLLAEQHCW